MVILHREQAPTGSKDIILSGRYFYLIVFAQGSSGSVKCTSSNRMVQTKPSRPRLVLIPLLVMPEVAAIGNSRLSLPEAGTHRPVMCRTAHHCHLLRHPPTRGPEHHEGEPDFPQDRAVRIARASRNSHDEHTIGTVGLGTLCVTPLLPHTHYPTHISPPAPPGKCPLATNVGIDIHWTED